MKSCTKSLFYIILLIIFLPSCVDNDYDIDDLNKNAVFKIPPIPLGNLDSLYINQLENISLPPGISFPNIKYVLGDTIKGLFSEEDISKFFPQNAEDGDYSAFVSKIDIGLKDINNSTNVIILFEVLDNLGRVIEEIDIPKQSITVRKDQDFRIEFKSEYMKYMKNAKDLKLIISITASIPTEISTDDYIFIKNISLQTSGLHFKL